MTLRTNGQYHYRLTGEDFHPDRPRRKCQRRHRRSAVLLCAVMAVLSTLWLLR